MGSDTLLGIFGNSGRDVNRENGYSVMVDLNPTNWQKKLLSDSIPPEDWTTVKYLNSQGNEHSDFLKIPDDSGGIIMWLIRPRKIPDGNQSVVACVCAAETSVMRTIRQFIANGEREYRGELSVKNMFAIYANELFVSYYSDSTRNDYLDMCKELNEMINPPIRFITGKISDKGESM